MKELATEKRYQQIMACVTMINKRADYDDEHSQGDVKRNVDHIKLMIDKYNWQDFDISQAHTAVTEHE